MGKVEESPYVFECEDQEFDVVAFEVFDEVVKGGDDFLRINEFKLSEFT